MSLIQGLVQATSRTLVALRATAEGALLVKADGPAEVTGPATDDELRATPLGVIVGPRVCLKTYSMLLTDASQTLAQVTQEAIPAGAVTVEIQAQGGSIRIKRDGGTAVATSGYQLDAGAEKTVDSVLADVRLIRVSAVATTVNLAFFNRV